MYLLDSNVFIEAKNRYYAFDICPGFWDWMDHIVQQRKATSIVMVYNELVKLDDELAKWVKDRQHNGLFLDVSDTATQQAFSEVIASIQQHPYSDPAKATFAGNADSWLIAKAISLQATIVTHEMPSAQSKKRVLIPNVCQEFNLAYMNTFDLLRECAASFVLNGA
ncbi:MAG: hypothetical protein HW380_419 [Magnetococcales bacterium]|nr:hypothetical protein [Magnetococcales bacterium]